MVSVNFKNAANKSATEIAATKKPSLVIDVMSSPYQIIEPSPEPVFDIFSDEENAIAADPKSSKSSKSSKPTNNTVIEEVNNDKEPDVILEELSRGPCTPPTENLDLAKGPQTPTEDPMDYDPCNPTESPTFGNFSALFLSIFGRLLGPFLVYFLVDFWSVSGQFLG